MTLSLLPGDSAKKSHEIESKKLICTPHTTPVGQRARGEAREVRVQLLGATAWLSIGNRREGIKYAVIVIRKIGVRARSAGIGEHRGRGVNHQRGACTRSITRKPCRLVHAAVTSN